MLQRVSPFAQRPRFAGRTASALLAGVILCTAAAPSTAAIAPWYPRHGEDSCKVVAGAAPRIETVPPRWQEQILRDFGWVGQDARIYTVPSVLDCRTPRPGGDSWSCNLNFVAWAKRNCAGIEVRE